jgi:GNAT superfamily N-acetyltransferase
VTTGWSIERLTAAHELESFDCGNPALTEWLKRYGLQSERQNDTRVFVAVNGDDEPARVRGYYALTASSVTETSGLTELFKGAFKGAKEQKVIGAILLARFGVDIDLQGQGVGTGLLVDILRRVHRLAEDVAFRVLMIEAFDEEARAWYLRRNKDFRELPTNSFQLYLPMKELKRAVVEAAG